MAYTYLTKEGYQKLKTELEDLVKERPKISAQIAEARDKGDLSENAEYDAAREAQGMLELRISKLQQTIDNARIIEEGQMDNSKVYLLSRVKIRNLKTKTLTQQKAKPEPQTQLHDPKPINNICFG